MRLLMVLCLCAGASTLVGCSILVDNKLDEKDDDGATEGLCQGVSDGTACMIEDAEESARFICRSQVCVISACGDGFIDRANGEECEDDDEISGDGCEPITCQHTCSADEDCADGNDCNGIEVCIPGENQCGPGETLNDGHDCTMPETEEEGVCRTGLCVSPGCGDGICVGPRCEDADDSGTEECDDGNEDSLDGCENDCTFTCEDDKECQQRDGDLCNGNETCNTSDHTCDPGTALACADTDQCTVDSCDPGLGCINDNSTNDRDMDGHFAESCGGDDCNDSDKEIYEGAEELCDGKDNNCDGTRDETAPTWFVDCDRDGYAADTSGSRTDCEQPPDDASGCTNGTWTTRRPIRGDLTTTDCMDNNALVHPGVTAFSSTAISGAPRGREFDYNCDGENEQNLTAISGGFSYCYEGSDGVRLTCIGNTYWNETFVPGCNATATKSSCVRSLIITAGSFVPTGSNCIRRSTESTQTCR